MKNTHNGLILMTLPVFALLADIFVSKGMRPDVLFAIGTVSYIIGMILIGYEN